MKVYESESTVNTNLNCSIVQDNPTHYSIRIGPFAAIISQRIAKADPLPNMPHESLTLAEAKIYINQWQQFVDSQNKNLSQWKKKKKKGGRT